MNIGATIYSLVGLTPKVASPGVFSCHLISCPFCCIFLGSLWEHSKLRSCTGSTWWLPVSTPLNRGINKNFNLDEANDRPTQKRPKDFNNDQENRIKCFQLSLLVWRPIRTEPRTSRKDHELKSEIIRTSYFLSMQIFKILRAFTSRVTVIWSPGYWGSSISFSFGEKTSTAFIQASCLHHYNTFTVYLFFQPWKPVHGLSWSLKCVPLNCSYVSVFTCGLLDVC